MSCHGLISMLPRQGRGDLSGKTYILPDDGAEARQPQKASPADLVDPQALAAEHGLAEPLPLVLLDDALRAGQVPVVADAPALAARQAQAGDVAQEGRAEQQLPGPREGRVAHLAAGDQLLHAELVRALERDGGAHGDHCSGLGAQRAPHRQLDRQDGVAVAVADAVRPAVEGAHVVHDRRRPHEVSGRRRPADQVRGVARVHRGVLVVPLRLGGLLGRVVALRGPGILGRLR